MLENNVIADNGFKKQPATPSFRLAADITVNESKDVCGKCHIRSTNTSGFGGECGGDSSAAILAGGAPISGSYIQHHEQYNELVGMNDGVHRTLNCVDCHDPHKRSHTAVVLDDREEIVAHEAFLLDDAEVAVFAYGVTARSARAAVKTARRGGLRVGLFRPISLWPFPDLELEKLAGQVKAIVVAEMNLGQLIYEVERVVRGKATIVACQKASGVPIHPDEILAALRELH